jgi:hypothetical protein
MQYGLSVHLKQESRLRGGGNKRIGTAGIMTQELLVAICKYRVNNGTILTKIRLMKAEGEESFINFPLTNRSKVPILL